MADKMATYEEDVGLRVVALVARQSRRIMQFRWNLLLNSWDSIIMAHFFINILLDSNNCFYFLSLSSCKLHWRHLMLFKTFNFARKDPRPSFLTGSFGIPQGAKSCLIP